jgi:hypothetical protein
MKLKVVVFLLFLLSELLRLLCLSPLALKRLIQHSVAQPHTAFDSRIAGLRFVIVVAVQSNVI